MAILWVHRSSLVLQGKHVEAETLYQEALAIDERIFGFSHPRIATHLNNLAELFRTLVRAEQTHRAVFEHLSRSETIYTEFARFGLGVEIKRKVFPKT